MAHLLILGLLWHLHNTIYYLLKIQFTLSTEYFLRNIFPKRNKKVAYYENWHEKGIQNTNSLNLKKTFKWRICIFLVLLDGLGGLCHTSYVIEIKLFALVSAMAKYKTAWL